MLNSSGRADVHGLTRKSSGQRRRHFGWFPRHSPPYWCPVYPRLKGGLPLRDSWVSPMTPGFTGSSLPNGLYQLSGWICPNNLSSVSPSLCSQWLYLLLPITSSLLLISICLRPANASILPPDYSWLYLVALTPLTLSELFVREVSYFFPWQTLKVFIYFSPQVWTFSQSQRCPVIYKIIQENPSKANVEVKHQGFQSYSKVRWSLWRKHGWQGEELILFLGRTWILKRQEKYANLNSILQWELNPVSN